MIRIPVDELEPGMKLVKPILAANGMVLLSEGSQLTGTQIERMKDMNVEVAFVEGKAPPAIAKEELLGQLEKRFRHVLAEPYMELLKKVTGKHIEGLYE